MADRGNRAGRGGGGYRGGRGGNRGGGQGGGSGAGGGQGAHQGGDRGGERPKKENILDLKKYMDQRITVKFNGGREGTSCHSFWVDGFSTRHPISSLQGNA